MATLKPNYLSKKGGQWRGIRLLDLAVLLFHIHKGAVDAEVGFEDARETLESITRRLSKRVFLDPALIESALWSCNLLDEKGAFWHPSGLSFDEFVKRVVSPDQFDKVYNVITKKGD